MRFLWFCEIMWAIFEFCISIISPSPLEPTQSSALGSHNLRWKCSATRERLPAMPRIRIWHASAQNRIKTITEKGKERSSKHIRSHIPHLKTKHAISTVVKCCLHAGFPFIWIKWLRRLLLLSCLDRLRSCVKLIEGAAKKLLLVSQLPFSLFHFQRVPDHFLENSLPLPARHNW